MNQQLTSMSYKVLCNLYRMYLEKLSKSNNRETSKMFTLNRIDTDLFQDNFFSNFTYETLSDYFYELTELGYLDRRYIGGTFCLTNKGIMEMENRFKNNLKELVDFIFNSKNLL